MNLMDIIILLIPTRMNHQSIYSNTKRKEISRNPEKTILDKLPLRPKINAAKSSKGKGNKNVGPNKIYIAKVGN